MERFMTKRNLIVLALILIFGFAFNWLFSHAFIEIQVSNQVGTNETSYILIDQRSGERSEAKTKTGKLRKLVRKGSYEVLVQQDKRSFLSIKQTGGFLGTTRTDATLVGEKVRTFVGNNPNSCMYFIAGVLASSPCSGTVDELEFHIPATASQATFTKKAAGPAAFLEAMLPTDTGAVAVISAANEDETKGNFHAAYSVNSSGAFSASALRELGDLDGSKQYTLNPYGTGYVAISADGSQMLFYPSFDQKPSKIDIEQPSDKTLRYLSSTAVDDNLVVIFSNTSETELPSFSDPEGERVHSEEVEAKATKKAKSEVVIRTPTKTQHLSLKQAVVQATLCGPDKLCLLLASGRLEVYQLHDDSQDLLFSMVGVLDIQKQQNNLRIIKSDGVFVLDLQKQEGFMVYSFGDYDFCGASRQTDSNIICIADDEGNRRALSIRMDQENTDSIDEKIAQLADMPEIKNVSIYGQFIHVSAQLGELDYQESIGGFGYDPAIMRSTSTAIDAEVKRLGIDTSKYTIVNPYR